MQEKPLVTFALFTYNQEQYIQEAIEGALAQTYSPLEIIISDDASTDNTFQIIKDKTKKYQGLHKVIVNRNDKNLGISSHVNKLFQLASGDLIIMAAGDDISLNNRVSLIVESWKTLENKIFGIYSDAIDIDANTAKIGISKREVSAMIVESIKNKSFPIGATCAWDKRVSTLFPPLSKKAIAEDIIFSFRAQLLGELKRIDKPLVMYRRSESAWKNTNSNSRIDRIKYKNGYLSLEVYNQMLLDLEAYSNSHIVPDCKSISTAINNKITESKSFIFTVEMDIKNLLILLFSCIKLNIYYFIKGGYRGCKLLISQFTKHI